MAFSCQLLGEGAADAFGRARDEYSPAGHGFTPLLLLR
jgi:hypothetical protein